MATFTGNSSVFLPALGYGLQFSGLIAIAPPSTKQNSGRVALLEIRSGALSSQNVWDGKKLSTISAIANQTNYRIGFIPGAPDDLKKNLADMPFDLTVSDRLIDLTGSIDVSAIYGLSRPAVVPPAPPTPSVDTTPPTLRLI